MRQLSDAMLALDKSDIRRLAEWVRPRSVCHSAIARPQPGIRKRWPYAGMLGSVVRSFRINSDPPLLVRGLFKQIFPTAIERDPRDL